MIIVWSFEPDYKKKKLKIDERLFRRIGQDDMAAFEELYVLTEKTIYAYALSIVRHHEDAMDVVSETFLKIRSAAHLYKPMGKPLAWMFTIARNFAMNRLREQGKYCGQEITETDFKEEFSFVDHVEDRMVLEVVLKKLTEEDGGNYRFEYSPESFTGTEVDYALEVCNAVLDIWQPTADNKVIINLPVTVEMSMPHIYAQQIEYMCKHMNYRENVIVSLHPHNDRGCGVADTEMGILAGADRIEGTLFGNGERTGNVDIITLAMNMYAMGIDPELNFTDMPHIVEVYERCTRMQVHMRQPYAGQLVFAAFSGSHQDAIAKGMHYRDAQDPDHWTVPYLPIDPRDVGRVYETDVIRINSQSGKGGIGYMLEEYYGYDLPSDMREQVGYYMKDVSDHEHKELLPNEINDLFQKEYMNVNAPYALNDYHFVRQGDIVTVTMNITYEGKTQFITATGNGRLDAVSNALRDNMELTFDILDYKEHALSKGSSSRAVSYVKIIDCRKKNQWGVGLHDDIIASSVQALFSAINRAVAQRREAEKKQRLKQ